MKKTEQKKRNLKNINKIKLVQIMKNNKDTYNQ